MRALTFLALSLPNIALAGDVTITWDESQTPNISTYKILKGEGSDSSRTYNITGFPIGEVSGDTFSYKVTGLAVGVHYFTVVACDAAGACSPMSAEFLHEVSPVDETPKAPTNLRASSQ